VKQRYEWVEIVFGKKAKTGGGKKCSHPDACALCRKKCPDRVR